MGPDGVYSGCFASTFASERACRTGASALDMGWVSGAPTPRPVTNPSDWIDGFYFAPPNGGSAFARKAIEWEDVPH